VNQTSPKIPISVWFYLIAFFSLLSFLPIILTASMDRGAASQMLWILSGIWPLVVGLLWFYANRQCSSDLLSFNDGLFWITGSLMTGWLYLSFVVVLPGLLIVFATSVIIAIYGKFSRTPAYSANLVCRGLNTRQGEILHCSVPKSAAEL
jgi:hypothetical protein